MILTIEEILSTASELKYTSAIKKILAEQYESPDEEFCKYFFSKANPGGRFTENAKDSFIPLVKQALNQFVSEKVSDRLRSALETEGTPTAPETGTPAEEIPLPDSDITTTEEELEAFRIVRAIAAQAITPERIVHRDAKTYMSILLDDNNRKPVCRLWFNTRQKYFGTFDADKNETKNLIESLSDIYQYGEQVVSVIQNYASQG